MKRAKSKTKQLKALLGRVYRDALRKGKALGLNLINQPIFTLI
jgi:hypothetical protein